jgi:hypothetical protein
LHKWFRQFIYDTIYDRTKVWLLHPDRRGFTRSFAKRFKYTDALTMG